MFKKFGLSLILVGLVYSHSASAQTASIGQQRIPQSIIIDGQPAQGVMIVQNGTVQTVVCPSPQNYVAADQSSSGWACYEPSTGMWLLHAQPPPDSAAPQTFTYQQPPVYVPAPTVPVYSYLAPGYYPFSYSPFYYPFFGPRFGFGFGFGFRSPIIGRHVFVSRVRPVAPVVRGRPFGGARGTGSGRAFGRSGRR